VIPVMAAVLDAQDAAVSKTLAEARRDLDLIRAFLVKDPGQ
jgi:hypothetical protein